MKQPTAHQRSVLILEKKKEGKKKKAVGKSITGYSKEVLEFQANRESGQKEEYEGG